MTKKKKKQKKPQKPRPAHGERDGHREDSRITSLHRAAAIIGHLHQLHAYVQDRARVEGVDYDLAPDFYFEPFLRGMRLFFGVHICNHGKMLADDQEPSPGYLDAWVVAFEARWGAEAD